MTSTSARPGAAPAATHNYPSARPRPRAADRRQPAQQLAVAGQRCREGLRAEHVTEVIDGGRNVRVQVGVDVGGNGSGSGVIVVMSALVVARARARAGTGAVDVGQDSDGLLPQASYKVTPSRPCQVGSRPANE